VSTLTYDLGGRTVCSGKDQGEDEPPCILFSGEKRALTYHFKNPYGGREGKAIRSVYKKRGNFWYSSGSKKERGVRRRTSFIQNFKGGVRRDASVGKKKKKKKCSFMFRSPEGKTRGILGGKPSVHAIERGAGSDTYLPRLVLKGGEKTTGLSSKKRRALSLERKGRFGYSLFCYRNDNGKPAKYEEKKKRESQSTLSRKREITAASVQKKMNRLAV